MKPSRPNDKSRRQFTKTIAAALVAAPLVSTLANAQTTGIPKEPSALPSPSPSPTTPPPSPVAEAYAEVARARFGKFVTPEQMTKVKEDLEGNVRASDRLRIYKLENDDEPDFVFTAG
jgi:hypothetical protein